MTNSWTLDTLTLEWMGKRWRLLKDFIKNDSQEIPNEGAPAEGYFYNTHMGAYVRSLDEAKYHLIQAKLAFFHKRTLVENPQGVVETSEKK